MQIEPQVGVRVLVNTSRGRILATITSVGTTRLIWTVEKGFFGNWSKEQWGGNIIPIPDNATADQVQALLSITHEP